MVIGPICEETGDLRLHVLPNRSVESFTTSIRENILEGTIIKTNGYPSYPAAVRANNCEHTIVNHTIGFVNKRGEHINTIESVWAAL